ncbi:cell number regulator 10-like [Juglans microcarpa x Juglans regia]|uniref:cell number regulator 10-like n=1 Tax=Juglans microcarpa x Juglans regia TaxID=2249226 RepID=UPI001B7E6683|nr:cell number regulator 10-like [Juglans microcarpa x Juglans regia]
MNIDHRSGRQPKWSASLLDFEDVGTCCITCCLPCITFGRIAEVVDEGQSSCVAQGFVYGCLMLFQCQWVISCMYREKLRSKFGLPEDPCCDCCVHFCCEPCALCQEHAELKHRGLDPSIGWIGPPNAPPPLQMPPSMYK